MTAAITAGSSRTFWNSGSFCSDVIRLMTCWSP